MSERDSGNRTRRSGLVKAALLLGLCVGLASCNRTETSTDEPTAGQFTITSPMNGETVGTEHVEVSGTAPPGAEVVRPRSFRPDARTTAGPSGEWSMEVELDEGRNELEFRLEDDDSTTQRLVLVLDPELAAASAAEQSPASPTRLPESSSPRPTRSPRATPTPVAVDPACLDAFEAADAVGEFEDSVEDIYPAVEACLTFVDWSAAFESVGGAGFFDDPLLILANACSYGEGLSGTPLCQEVTGMCATAPQEVQYAPICLD